MPEQRPTHHIVRIDITKRGNTDVHKATIAEGLGTYFKGVGLTMGMSAILFRLPVEIDTITVAEFVDSLNPQVRRTIRRVTMFEDSDEAEAEAVA